MRFTRLLLLALCLLLPLATASADMLIKPPTTQGRIVEIPMDADSVNQPDERYYITANEYADPSLTVKLVYGRAYDTDYIAAYVKLANASQIRTAMESFDGRDTAFGTRIARHSGAVLAINGDYFRYNLPGWNRVVVRQGRTLMNTPYGEFDVLIVDEHGDFTIFPKATREDMQSFTGYAVNVFSFGPALALDGQPLSDIVDNNIASGKPQQRLGIAQTGELEYLIVATAGPENPNNKGMILDDFAQLICSLGDVRCAYNLDGGSSTTMVFRGQKINEFGSKGRQREITDMIVFVSAWEEN